MRSTTYLARARASVDIRVGPARDSGCMHLFRPPAGRVRSVSLQMRRLDAQGSVKGAEHPRQHFLHRHSLPLLPPLLWTWTVTVMEEVVNAKYLLRVKRDFISYYNTRRINRFRGARLPQSKRRNEFLYQNALYTCRPGFLDGIHTFNSHKRGVSFESQNRWYLLVPLDLLDLGIKHKTCIHG